MSDGSGPLPHWPDATCVVCPAQVLGPGCFDVVAAPGPRYRHDPNLGYRTDAETGVPVCVHPFRVRLAPGRYASDGEGLVQAEPIPATEMTTLPDHVEDLEAWFIAVVRTVDPDRLSVALEQAEGAAAERFGGEQTVAALRRVFAYELA